MKKQTGNPADKSKNKNLNPIIIGVLVVLSLYAISLFFILGWGLLTSLKSSVEYFQRADNLGGPNVLGFPDVEYSKKYFEIIKKQPYSIFQNYRYVIDSFNLNINSVSYYSSIFGNIEQAEKTTNFFYCLFNSIFYAAGGALANVFVLTITAYACSKYKYKFSEFIYMMLLVVMTLPLFGTQPSMIKFLRDIGLYNTYFSMIIMNASFAGMYFFVFYAFFQGLSNTYIEAAEIDGASQTRIFFQIIIPLTSKMMGTVFLITLISLWNNYEVIRLYYPSIPTLSYGVFLMVTDTTGENRGFDTQSTPQRIAGCMFLAIPIIILFLALQNIIMGNLSLGGIKE